MTEKPSKPAVFRGLPGVKTCALLIRLDTNQCLEVGTEGLTHALRNITHFEILAIYA